MNKKIIALAIATAAASASSHAVEVYNDGSSTLSVGGRLAASAKFSDGENSLGSQSSRINFRFTHALESGWDIGTTAEWGFDALANSGKDNLFFNRLGNITADKENIGHFTLGKAWSVHYDVSGATERLWIFGGDTTGNYDGIVGDGGPHGTGRADDVLQYRNNIAGLQFGLQYQFEDKNSDFHRDYGYQAMAGYDFDFGLGLSAVYAETKFKDREDAKIANAVVKYEMDALYLAANYSQSRNHQQGDKYFSGADTTTSGAIKEATGLELFGSYNINQFQLLAGYNQLEDDNSDAKYAYATVGAAYFTGPVIIAAEYKMDASSKNGNGSNADKDDVLGLLVRYNF